MLIVGASYHPVFQAVGCFMAIVLRFCDDDSFEDVKLTYIALWVGRLTLWP